MFAWKEPIGLIILPFVDFANHKPDEAAIYSKSNAKSQTYDKDNDFFFIATSEGQR